MQLKLFFSHALNLAALNLILYLTTWMVGVEIHLQLLTVRLGLTLLSHYPPHFSLLHL